jgi:hypothetical protein
MASFEVVVLEQLFILKMAELGLNSVKLVPQRQIILVALLDLEDFRFELTNE